MAVTQVLHLWHTQDDKVENIDKLTLAKVTNGFAVLYNSSYFTIDSK